MLVDSLITRGEGVQKRAGRWGWQRRSQGAGELAAQVPLRGWKGTRIVGLVLVDARVARWGGQVDEIGVVMLMVSLIAHGGDNEV